MVPKDECKQKQLKNKKKVLKEELEKEGKKIVMREKKVGFDESEK